MAVPQRVVGWIMRMLHPGSETTHSGSEEMLLDDPSSSLFAALGQGRKKRG